MAAPHFGHFSSVDGVCVHQDGTVGGFFQALGVWAFWVLGAGQELPVPSPFDDHHLPAFFAGDIGRLSRSSLFLAHQLFSRGQNVFKGNVKLADDLAPFLFPGLHLVQFAFHLGREFVVENGREIFHQKPQHQDCPIRPKKTFRFPSSHTAGSGWFPGSGVEQYESTK